MESLSLSQPGHTHHFTARRKLSSSFNLVQFSSLPVPIAEGGAPELSSNQLSSRQGSSPEGSVDGEGGEDGEHGDQLMQSSSSDNVFMDTENISSTFQPLYPGNRRSSTQSDQSNFHALIANTSPQVSRLRPHRPNPLISHTNGSRARSQSAVFAGREEPFSLTSNSSPLNRRATLAMVGRYHAGNLSPLTSGHKSRTPSGELGAWPS